MPQRSAVLSMEEAQDLLYEALDKRPIGNPVEPFQSNTRVKGSLTIEITEPMDVKLSHLHILGNLDAGECELDDLTLENTRIEGDLNLCGSRIGHLNLEGVSVRGKLRLSDAHVHAIACSPCYAQWVAYAQQGLEIERVLWPPDRHHR